MSSRGLAGETETFVRYGINSRLEVGFGYLWRPHVIRPLASYTLIPEAEKRPSLTAGLMFDALGGGRQGGYLIAAKDLQSSLKIPASLYIGSARISNEDNLRFLAGTSFRLTSWLTASLQYEGRYVNFGLTARVGSIGRSPVSLGVVAARGTEWGPLLAISMPIGR